MWRKVLKTSSKAFIFIGSSFYGWNNYDLDAICMFKNYSFTNNGPLFLSMRLVVDLVQAAVFHCKIFATVSQLQVGISPGPG